MDIRPGLVESVRQSFTPALLHEPWRSRVLAGAVPSTGHCYAASEALFHLLGGKPAGWTPVVVRHEGGPHWFLQHDDGTILDATVDQFTSLPPYAQGVRKGFLTRMPSKRAQILMESSCRAT